MKRNKLRMMVPLAVGALFLAACGGDSDEGGGNGDGGNGDGDGGGGDRPSVVSVVSGPLGDRGFFDDAERGMQMIAEAGSETQTIESEENNPSQWKSNLQLVSNGEWDLVITGTTQQHDNLDEVAQDFPEQMYITYDDVVEQPNVASITYAQNEGSFLAGVLAGLATTDTDTFDKAEGSKKVGVLGGMDIPVINDFVVGFEKGVESVDEDIEVLVSYVGDFNDPNTGYDQSKAMFEQGADVVFAVAGGSGLGTLKASADADKYSIGVDQDQNDEEPGHVIASMLKDIGVSLENAVDLYADGELEFGETTVYGLEDDGVKLVYAEDVVPQEIIDEVDSYIEQVLNGEIEVPTAF